MTFKNLQITILILLLCIISCNRTGEGFTAEELALINGADSIMRVLTIENPSDEAVLRAKSVDLSVEALLSDEFRRLAELMIATVTHPSQDGVGIAGPQVGLNRRVVAVQRFDKEPVERNGRIDHPFEVYPNVRVVWASDSLAAGPEGCLSVPDRRGNVLRSQRIIIEYVDMEALKGRGAINGNVCQATGRGTEDEAEASGKVDEAEASGKAAFPMVSDTVCGFTAVIFQHEIDHLDGVLYIDRL
jgi:peptide deformylase